MKFSVSLLLLPLLLFDTLQGSTLPHVRKVRALNTTLQTNFNGTYERRNPCTNAEIESSSYIASHEFHHHTNEDNWSDYSHKCSAIISGFLQAIGNLVRFNNKQNGLFNFHINTSISQKQVGDHKAGKCCESVPTILIEATDCEVTPRTNKNIVKEEKAITEGKYDGPVCLLNNRKKGGPETVSATASNEQTAEKINPPVKISNPKIPQKEYYKTEDSRNLIKTSLGASEPPKVERSQTVPNSVAQTTYEQTSAEFETPTTPLPEPRVQVIPVTTSYESSQPNFDLENSPGFQATAFENTLEQKNFNPPAATPNMPYAPQPSFNEYGIPPQSVVSVGSEELINQNQLPPALPNEQGLPAMYPQQPSDNNLDGQVTGPVLREPLPTSHPDQIPVFLPPSQTTPQGNPQGNSPAFTPTYNGPNPNVEFSGNYLPPPDQAPSMKSSFELPPPDYNNNPSDVGFTETQATGQISDMTQNVENNFTPDQQQQTINLKTTETVYEPINYNQVPTTPTPEIQPEFVPTEPSYLPAEPQQELPAYPSEIPSNDQPPMKPMEVLPPDSVAPNDAVFSDSLVISNGEVGDTFNSPVENSFLPVIPLNSQPPVAPAFTAPQEKPLEQESTLPPPVESKSASEFSISKSGIPLFQLPQNQVPDNTEVSDNPPINSFSNQPALDTFTQSVPADISLSNDFSEQSTDKFATPQQPDSIGLIPLENTPPQPISTLGPQPSPDFTGQLQENEMFGAGPQNFQEIVPVDVVPLQSSPVVAPISDTIPQTFVEDSQFDYPTSTEKPEPSISGLVPDNIGNQLSELTTYNKPVLNSNDFQPETQSYITEPSDRNLDYTTQTPFYDSIPATYKNEPESQPDLISSAQNSQVRSTAPAPDQALPPYGSESFPIAPLTPELPPSTPVAAKTESYSEQITPEFGSAPQNPEFVNPPRNDFAEKPGPQFVSQEQTFLTDRDTVAEQQPNPIPEISNPLDTIQPPVESIPVIPVQQQPQFYPNQNGDIQQSLPETALTSQTSDQTVSQQQYETTGPETNQFPNAVPLQDQPVTAVYPQPPAQSGVQLTPIQPDNQPPMQSSVQNYEIQPANQPPNAPAYSPTENMNSQDESYPEAPQNENQPLQAAPQPVLPYQPPSVQIPSDESQEQFINPETTSAESTSNTFLESNITPAAPIADDSFSVEQQSADFDGSQMSQQNYPNPGYPSRQVLPVELPATQATASQSFSGQSDSNLNYDGVQPNGMLQPEPQMPVNDQLSMQTNSNSQQIVLPQQTGSMNFQNGENPKELEAFVPPASPQQTGVASFPVSPLQTVPENSQVNNFPLDSAFGSTVSAAPEMFAIGMDNVMLNPDQPSGVSQPERQDLNIQDQFPPAVTPQFTTQSSGEVTTDNPNPNPPQPSEDYFSGVTGVQTTNQKLTSIDEYQGSTPTTQEPLNYFQERPDDVAQTTPPPPQADQLLTSSQSQFEYVQNNAAMYSPNLAPRPQPQPSFDNLTEFPGDKTAGSTTQTPLPSEIKPETLGSQRLLQTALTETNIPDTDNTKTLDTQPKSRSSDYLDSQIYPSFDVPAPAVNYPRQDRRSFPPTADSITRDTTYQTTSPASTPSQTVPTFGKNPIEMVFNSNSSYFSTTMTPSEGLGMQPFRQASALIASPQPQSTTVKYNEQIIIPQYQMPTASNPQPQATLENANRHSGDNTTEGLLESVAWTFPGPQEAMATTPPPQYQITPLRSQFPPSNMEFNNENKGRPFQPTQKQLLPVTPSSVTPTPPFEQQKDYSRGKTTTKTVEEIITTDFSTKLAHSSPENQLAYADKLLNSSITINEYDQRMGQKPPGQRQQIYFTPTKTREVVTETFVTPSTPAQHPLEIQNQLQIQSLTNPEEIQNDYPVDRQRPFEQEIKVQTQPQLQSSSSTNMKEIKTDSAVIPPLAFPQQINVQPQTELQPFSYTISGEKVTDSFVNQPPPFQPQTKTQPQPQFEELDSTNIREDLTVPPVIPPFQPKIQVQPQTELQPFSSTISREVISDPYVSQPPPFQPQTQVQPQQQFQIISSTNTKEGIADSPVTPSLPFQQQIDLQPQDQPQSFSSTISREILTDSLVSQPPPVQPQIEKQFQPQVEDLESTNIREVITMPPETPPPPFQQQVHPETELQPFSSAISRDVVTDSFASQPPSLQPQIEVQSQPKLQQLESTKIREVISVPPVTTTQPPFQQQIDVQPQTELQPFSLTISRETVTDSVTTALPSFQPQIQVQPQQQLQIISSTNTKEGIADSPVTPSPVTQQQIDVQPQTELQPFSSAVSREVITDSFVSQPPPLQSQIEVQSQPELQQLDTTNITEVITVPPVTPPSVNQQQLDFQLQTQPQSFSSTISREIVVDSLTTPLPSLQPQTKIQPQPQVEGFDSTSISELVTEPPVMSPPPLKQQIDIRSQTQPQPFSSTISRDIVAYSLVTPSPPILQETEKQFQPQIEEFDSTDIREDKAIPPVTPSPPFQPQIQVQPQQQFQIISSTNTRERIADFPVTPPTPFQQQIDVQPQTELQPFSSTVSREVITDSFVNRPPPLQSEIEVQSQPQLQQLNSTNIREVITVPPVTPPPVRQQEIDVQSQIQPQSLSSTISREVITDSYVSQPPPIQPQIQVQPQQQFQVISSRNLRDRINDSPVTPSPVTQQQIDIQPQTQLQPFSSTISREIISDSITTPLPPMQPQIQVQAQPKLEEIDSKNIREHIIVPPVTPLPVILQEIDVQAQAQPQPFSSTISREIITESYVNQPPTFQPQTQVQSQPKLQQLESTNIREAITVPSVTPPPATQQQIDVQPQKQPQQFSSTISREIVTDSLTSPLPSFQSEIHVQPQQQFQIISSTNAREGIADSPVTPPLPFQPQIQVQPQTELQPFSSTISREIVTDSLVSQPPPVQPQIEKQFQPQVEDLESTNIREVITMPPVTQPTPFEQKIDIQPQTKLQPFSSIISREIVTDSLVSQPPSFQQQTEVQSQPELQQLDTTNIREVITVPPVTPPPPFQQQIDLQPQDQPQSFSPTISREILTDTLVSQPPPLQSEIEVQSQPELQQFDTTNIREVITVPPVTPPPVIQQEIDVQSQNQPQSFSSTISREVISDSYVSQPPRFQPQTQVQPQQQFQIISSTNTKEGIADSPVTPPLPFQPQIQVQPQTELQPFSSTISREIVTDSLVSQPPPFSPQIEDQPQPQVEELDSINIREAIAVPPVTPPPLPQQKIDVQSQTQPQSLSSTISREIITDSYVSQPPLFQPQTQVQPQQQFQIISSTNTKEGISDSPVTPPPPFQQQIDLQPQDQPQSFSPTISREILTDTLVSQPPPVKPQIQKQFQPQVEELESTDIREVITMPPVTPPPPFQQQVDVHPETELQPFSSTISSEVVTDSFASQPPSLQPQSEVQSQPNLQQLDSTKIREVISVPLVTTTQPPFQQQIDVQPQTELQPFSLTISRETVTDSVTTALPSFQPQIQVQPQQQLQVMSSRNTRDSILDSAVIPPPVTQQEIDVQQQTQPQTFSSTTSREVVIDSLTTPPPPMQPQIQVQTQPKLEEFDSTNIREVVTVPPVVSPPPFEQQIDVQPQTELQPFSSTISREILTDSLVSQQPPVEPQIEVQSEPQLLAISSSNTGDIITVSPVSQSPPVQQHLEVQPQPELKSFSSTNSSTVLTDSHVALLQQDVDTQRQPDLQNFSSRNTTKTVSDSIVSAPASLQEAKNQLHAGSVSAVNITKVATDSLGNPPAKLEAHIAQEIQTQHTRYTTTNTKEVITESFLPTSESIYVESGKDGKLKTIEIRSDSEANSPQGKTTTEVVEETVVTDFPPATEFSSFEDQFNLADKLLNDSTPVLKTTSFVTISPRGEKVVTAAVEIQKPVDQISVNTTPAKAAIPLSKSASVNHDQVLPVQAPKKSDEVVASNLNSKTTGRRADRQPIFKSDLRSTYVPKYSQFGLAEKPTTVSPMESLRTAPSDFQTSEDEVLFKPTPAPDYQESSITNPLLQTLATHLNFALHEPPKLSSSKPGPRRASPSPLISDSYLELIPTFPMKTRKLKAGPYLIKFEKSEKAGQETKSGPWPDPLVPVSNPTDPSNGPETSKVLKNSSVDEVAPDLSNEHF